MPFELHLATGPGGSIVDQIAAIEQAEQLGFAGTGVADHVEDGKDAFVILGLAAARTSAISLYTAVTNPKSRHPFHLAVVANTLAELYPGRTKLGIGTGDSVIVNLGTKPATVDAFRDALQRIRALLDGEMVPFGTNPNGHIENPAKPRTPLMVTASGPRALRTAGELGDEAMLLAGLSAPFRAQSAKRIAEGAAVAGRDPASIPVTYNAAVSIDDDAEAAHARVWPVVFTWLKMGFFNDGLQAVGLSVPEESDPGAVDPAAAKELVGHLAIAGTPASVVERIGQLRSEGVERLYCFLFAGGEARQRQLALLKSEVIDA